MWAFQSLNALSIQRIGKWIIHYYLLCYRDIMCMEQNRILKCSIVNTKEPLQTISIVAEKKRRHSQTHSFICFLFYPHWARLYISAIFQCSIGQITTQLLNTVAVGNNWNILPYEKLEREESTRRILHSERKLKIQNAIKYLVFGAIWMHQLVKKKIEFVFICIVVPFFFSLCCTCHSSSSPSAVIPIMYSLKWTPLY